MAKKKATTPRIAALAALLTLNIGALEAIANEIHPSGVCTANFAFNSLLPMKVDAQFLHDMQAYSGAKIVRHIRAGEAYTMDYRDDRLYVFSDKENFYTGHKCG
ncbi:hypothetical protein J3P84_01035 [Pseudomonas sp. Z1-29]|uniref:hypothetical protein n=1 Tax=unclassified Pseudomonas TaxID=196821 RepID=UPI003DA99FA5